MDVVEGEEAKHVADGEGPLRRRAPSCGIAAPLSELGEMAERRRLADESVSGTKENARRARGGPMVHPRPCCAPRRAIEDFYSGDIVLPALRDLRESSRKRPAAMSWPGRRLTR